MLTLQELERTKSLLEIKIAMMKLGALNKVERADLWLSVQPQTAERQKLFFLDDSGGVRWMGDQRTILIRSMDEKLMVQEFRDGKPDSSQPVKSADEAIQVARTLLRAR